MITETTTRLRAPFPWFGGKRRIASQVWEAFGNPANYIEPFFGSGAVLLARPTKPGYEVVNDWDCYLANFWRALQHAPEELEAAFDRRPRLEVDLTAGHKLLREGRAVIEESIRADLHFYDIEIAALWVWGACASLGDAWLRPTPQRPALYTKSDSGILQDTDKRTSVCALAGRMKNVFVLCGDWERAVTNSRLRYNTAVTAIFLDPPYDESEHGGAGYASRPGISSDVREWAAANGDNPMLRIALCGYAGEGHEALEALGWRCVPWKAAGGYSSLGDGEGRDNAARERIWYSPHCLTPESIRAANAQGRLFG